jgi:ethanolamine utilization protein EutN
MLIVQFYAADGRSPDGDPVIAVDTLGAGPGERVLLTSDGKTVRTQLKSETTPVRWSVMGICDS